VVTSLIVNTPVQLVVELKDAQGNAVPASPYVNKFVMRILDSNWNLLNRGDINYNAPYTVSSYASNILIFDIPNSDISQTNIAYYVRANYNSADV
jgi:hypothetical protein